jgi:hypothetical protein
MVWVDGKNIQHFSSSGLDLIRFLRMYHEQHMLAAALQPGYPAETVGRTLVMWISWLLNSHGE